MEETSYGKSMELLSEDEKATLLAKMDEWEKASPQIANNFKREHFLPEKQMRELMCFIVNEGVPIGSKKGDMQDKIYADYQLKGGEIKVSPSPKRVGFAVPKESYINFLLRKYRTAMGSDRIVAERYLNRLLKDGVIGEKILGCLFNEENFLIWVTWDKNNEDNPFSFLTSANENPVSNRSPWRQVQVALGLDEEKYAGQHILLFFADSNKLEKRDDKLFRPTFCDADFGQNFRPTPVDFNDHGLTWPLGEAYSEEEHPKKGRPEAVVRSKHIAMKTIEKMVLITYK
jgi:hypothetical protein